jgi:hypothetical protein
VEKDGWDEDAGVGPENDCHHNTLAAPRQRRPFSFHHAPACFIQYTAHQAVQGTGACYRDAGMGDAAFFAFSQSASRAAQTRTLIIFDTVKNFSSVEWDILTAFRHFVLAFGYSVEQ